MKIIYYILLIICFIYIYGYFVNPQEISIIQSSLKEFDLSFLLRKQPIVIDDCIKDVLNVINLWFSTNIINDARFNNKYVWNKNSYKYIYMYALADQEVYIYPPNFKIINDEPSNKDPIIAIKLKQCQSLILPFKWSYNIKNIDFIKLYGIHDYTTYILDIFI